MNRYRRVLAVAASAVIGVIGALALTGPASAHHSAVSGTPVCDTETGEWVVTWTVNSFAPNDVTQFKLVEVQSNPPGTLAGIAVTADDTFPHATATPLTGVQRLPGDAESASLAVRAQWSNGYQENQLVTGYVTFGGPCEKPVEPGPVQATDASSCEELTVTVLNPEDGAAATVVVTASVGEESVSEEFDLAPGASETVTFPAAEGLTYEVTVDGEVLTTGAWVDPGNCGEEVEIPISSVPDCDSLTIEITNPLEEESIEATVTSGDVVNTLTIAPGEVGEVTIDAEEGTVATVEIVGGEAPLDIPWEQPEGCDGGGGGLPVTGAPTGIVIGAALALLAVGGGLFMLARRRRITFTA